MVLNASERTLKRVMRVASIILLAVAALAAAGFAIGPLRLLLDMTPLAGWLVAAALLAAMLCIYAGGDPRRRRELAGISAAMLALMALAGIAAWLLRAGLSSAPLSGALLTDHLLLGSAVLYAILAAVIVWASGRARQALSETEPSAAVQHWPVGAPDAGLHIVLPPVGVVFAVAAIAAAAAPFIVALEPLLGERLVAAHVAGAAAALAAVCFYVAGDTANRLPVLSIALMGLGVATAATLLTVLLAEPTGTISVGGRTVSVAAVLWVVVAYDAVVAVLLFVLKHRAYRTRLEPKFLGTTEYRALMALSDVIVRGPFESVPPAKIAANVDGYLQPIRARRKWAQRLALRLLQLHPVLYLKAPLSELDEEDRLEHLKEHFHRRVLLRMVPKPLRPFVAVIRVAQQLTYIGYYSDPGSFAEVGYEPFTKRRRFDDLDRAGAIPPARPHPLAVMRPDDVTGLDVDADVCVIGSGAGGAIVAYELARRGLGVVVLERGRYVEPRAFTEDEVEMIGKLYADGAFQQTEDFRFTVLQGSCVGGTTVVNNAVSFRTPPHALARWNTEYHAGVDPAGLAASTDHIVDWLPILAQEEGSPPNPHLKLNPSYPKFLAGVAARASSPGHELDVGVVDANIKGCLGCGYCNLGCKYGKKLSMLDTVLPWSQRDFGDRVRIYSECEVRGIVTSNGSRRRATAVRARLADGRTLTVRVGKVVVCAGAVASSYLLQRSGIGRGLPVGRHLCFNMGAPLTAEFDDDMAAYDGLQISHFGVPRPERGWVFETWWNPPVAQAINMPGWFEQHFRNMRRYRRLMAVGALVGTERNARVGHALTGGPAIHYVPAPGDMRKLGDALIELGQILFAAGARRVMVNAWEYYEFTSPNGLYELPHIMRDPSTVALGTGHPQGGNAISTDPSLGVVDANFRVHGYENVYICDASVIPSSLTVNPQLTVMALAHYAAPRIAGEVDS